MIMRFLQKLWLGILNVLPFVLLGGFAAFFLIGPMLIERSENKIDGEPLLEVSDEARALHATLTIVDLHSDTLMWSRSLLERSSRGHMDVPRMHDGNVTLQVFSCTLQFRGIPATDCNVCTFPGKDVSNRFSDSLGSSRNYRNAVLKFQHT